MHHFNKIIRCARLHVFKYLLQLWDVRNHKCIQTISDRQVYPSDDTLLCMSYDFKRKRLLTGEFCTQCWMRNAERLL